MGDVGPPGARSVRRILVGLGAASLGGLVLSLVVHGLSSEWGAIAADDAGVESARGTLIVISGVVVLLDGLLVVLVGVLLLVDHLAARRR